MNTTNTLSTDQIRLKTGILCFYLLWTFMLLIQLFTHSILDCELASWDGYERSAWASTIWYDIRHFDLYHLWKHTNEQVVWPPLHSWVTGVLFVLFGASLETARLVCLGSLWLSSLFLFRCISVFSVGGIYGAVTAWLLLTTSPFAAHHAASIMSELPGLCLVYAVLAFLPNDHQEKKSYVVSGVLLGALFLYKYNYAGLTFAALLFSRWLQSGFAVRRFFTKENMHLFGIPLLIFALWFIPDFKEKWGGFTYFAANNPNARTPLSWESIILYPQDLPAVYFAAEWVCYASGVIMLAAVCMHPIRFVTHPVFTLLWVHFLAAVFHPMKDIRFVFIPMGMWFLLTGISLQWIVQKCSWLQSTKGKSILFTLFTFLTVQAVIVQHGMYTKPHLSMENRHESVVHHLTDHIEHEDFVGLFISHDLFMPPAINFYFNTMMDTVSRRSYQEPQRWSFYFLMQPREQVMGISKEDALKAMRHEFFLRRTNKIIVLQSLAPEKIVNFDLWYGGADEMRKWLDDMPEVHLTQEKRYEDIDLLVKIYRIY